ncbi:membrane protein [Lysobacter helvus]|uniref:Membrane protein n=2 Tax=Lysobacteraceae TaxID=32033 RepID=A0ABN6FT15_9GAMM|nr:MULTISPECIES: AsmA family protein [Lysobacter]BCT92793.1 membrane protein [Lysobacter caseinilyticus]BCT95946.1 membrane protein [Lysobacter helvus]
MATPKSDPDAPRPLARGGPLAPLARHPFLTVLGVLAVGIALLLAFWDWNWFKPLVERQVEARTGRKFHIIGNLDVDRFGWTPLVQVGAFTFGNASWSKEPTMVSADCLQFAIELKPLLFHREYRLPEIRLRKPRMRLEYGPGHTGNWVFGEASTDTTQYGALWIDDGRLRFLDASRNTDIDVAVHSDLRDPSSKAPPVLADGGGRWEGRKFKLDGRAETPLALRETTHPYRIDVHVTAGTTRAHARGTLLDPFRLRGFNLKLALAGQNLADLYPLLGIAAPDSPPYSFDGRFTREQTPTSRTGTKDTGNIWHYDDFTGKLGDSDLGGDASFETGRKRPILKATLVSKRLDFDDLAGFVGKPPAAGAGETATAEQAAKAAQERAKTRVLPDKPYELDKLRAMDADVRWKAHRINAPKLPLDDMDAHLLIDAGLLRLDPLNFGVAGGDIRSTIRMDARESPIHTRADMQVRGLSLPQLLPESDVMREAVGRVGGDIHITGTGNSIAKMLGSANGTAQLGMGHGQISNLLMEYAGIDIAEALKFLVEGDRRIPIRCAFADFEVRNGVMTTQSLAFDTTDTLIVGEGSVNLRDETLDLHLRPRPKDRSLFAFRSPLLVGGTFKDPSFRPDLKRVGLRGAIALSLATITPPAALLATIELGPGKDVQCGGKYAK